MSIYEKNLDAISKLDSLKLTSDIVCAYISNNKIEVNEIKNVLQNVYSTVQSLIQDNQNFPRAHASTPYVPIEDSVTDDYIVCLEDGKKLQMLKRHLSTFYKMSIDEYKTRWGLSADYPTVAPSYARRRSQIAKTTGLGQSGGRKRKIISSDILDSTISDDQIVTIEKKRFNWPRKRI